MDMSFFCSNHFYLLNSTLKVSRPAWEIKEIFKKLFTPSEFWFPFPIIQHKDVCDAQKRRQLYGLDPESFIHGGHDTKSFQEIVNEVVVAANATEAWMMMTRQVKHLLGFYEDALQPNVVMGRYNTALGRAMKQLSPEKFNALKNAAHTSNVTQRDDYHSRSEMVSKYFFFRSYFNII